MVKTAINVALFGMEQREANTLELAFKNRAKGVCHIDNNSQAQVALFNLDAKGVKKLVIDFHKNNPQIPTIGMCVEPSDNWSMTQVKIPLSIMTLVQVILKANLGNNNTVNQKINPENKLINHITEDKVALAMKAIESRSIAKNLNKRVKNKNNSRAIPKQNTETHFDTNCFLLGHVIDAIKNHKNEITSLTCWGDKFIFINPKTQEISTDLTDREIRNLAIARLTDKQIRNLDTMQLNNEKASPVSAEYIEKNSHKKLQLLNTEKKRVISFEVFMWNLGLMTSRGRLPNDTSTDKRLHIRRWPNLTRVSLPENIMRVIAYWIRNPCSLMHLNEQLDIPLNDLFTIYTAAWSANLIHAANRKSDKLLKTETVYENDKRGLFTSILSRLRNFNNGKNQRTVQSK